MAKNKSIFWITSLIISVLGGVFVSIIVTGKMPKLFWGEKEQTEIKQTTQVKELNPISQKETNKKSSHNSEHINREDKTQDSIKNNANEHINFYIVNIIAVKSENKAKVESKRLKSLGYKSSYLWIPDYKSLSGAQFFTVYLGPYKTIRECEIATENYKKIDSKVYGTWVGNKNKRIEIRGVGKVKVIEDYRR